MRNDFGQRLISVKTVMEYECNPDGEFGFVGKSGYTERIERDNLDGIELTENMKEEPTNEN